MDQPMLARAAERSGARVRMRSNARRVRLATPAPVRRETAPVAADSSPPPERSWLLGTLDEAAAAGRAPREPDAIASLLRERIVSALHVGRVHSGDRLPSLREAASALGVTHHAVLKAYATLAREGLVEARACSGTYVAGQDRLLDRPLGETAEWLVEVLQQACEHQIRIPFLPDLLHRWTATATVRCACIAPNRDDLFALQAEAEQQFGVRTVGLRVSDFTTTAAGADGVPADALTADAWVTTTLGAPRLQPHADRLGKPLIIAAMAPQRVLAVQERLRVGRLTVVCMDPGFGEQLRQLFDPGGDRVRVVLADDRERLRTIDEREPVFLTRAAREELRSVQFRLLVTPSPAFCASFARGLVTLLIHFNLHATARSPNGHAEAPAI